MKKIGLLTIVFLAGFCLTTFAANDIKPSSQDQKKSQALWVAQVLSSEDAAPEERALALTYIDHVMGSIEGYRPDFLKKLYPNLNRMDIRDAVIAYYQNNPGERHKKVGDVLLSGCK